MKKLVVAVILLLGILFIISRFTEVQEIGLVIRQANLWIIGLAACVVLIWIMVMGATFQALFRLVGIEKNLFSLTRLVIAVNFINLVAPSAGMGGMAVLYSDALRNGHSSARITVGSALFLIFDYFGLLTVIFIGLILLRFYNTLHITEIIAYILFLSLAIFLTLLLILAANSEQKLAAVLTWLARTANRITKPFHHREILPVARAEAFAHEAAEGIKALKHVRRGWILPAALTLVNKSLLVTVFGLMFLAFNIPIEFGKLVAGFSIGYLFVIVSPTPAGVGIVEGVLTLALTSLAVPLEAATVVTIAFRGLTFWLPLLIGMIAFRNLHKD